jgi:1-acyl-sn-glycerol-3-phosphate acyltransferase
MATLSAHHDTVKTRSAHASRVGASRRLSRAVDAAALDDERDTPVLPTPWEREESLGARWLRRAVTVPAYLAAALLAIVLLPAVVVVTLVLDARELRRAPRTRFVVGVTFILLCETAGLAGALLNWTLAGGPFGSGSARAHQLDRALQRWWASVLLHRGRRILGLGLNVAAAEGVLDDGPILVLARHASLVDSLLPCVLLDSFRLRYVLKRELLWEPCLDIVGTRLPNAFVRRGVGDPGEIARVAALARGLERDEGVVLFPEGTRFTPERRQHLIDRLDARGEAPRLHEAGSLRHVLPPRRGGVLALLEAAPTADVVILAHTGLEDAARLSDLWRGSLLRGTIDVELWRVPRTEIPADAAGREAWLQDCWRRVDQWVDAHRGAARRGTENSDASAQ